MNMQETSELLREASRTLSSLYLQTGHSGWQHQAHIVSMHHGQDTNGACGYTP